NEAFVASDVQALLQYTNRFMYLDDREVAVIDGGDIKIFSANGYAINKKIVELNWDPQMVEKQGYAHYMLKEIYEQPRAVAAAIAPHVNPETFSVQLKNVGFGAQVTQLEELNSAEDWKKTLATLKDIERVFIIACGTSSYAGMVGKYLFEQIAQLPVEVDIASEFRYRKPVIPPKSLVMTISQSGETADTLAAIRLAKEKGATTLSICNVRSSTIDREAHGHLYMNSGPEIGVASTKAFTSTLAVLNCVAVAMGRARNVINAAEEKVFVQALLAAPSQMEVVLAYDKYFDEAAHKLKAPRLNRGRCSRLNACHQLPVIALPNPAAPLC
ncbi:MAG: SIS domain-containing protein, partial [Sphingobacteriales bacterium]